MKKIATVIAIIIAFIVVGYVCWRYFDNNFKDYKIIAEIDASEDDEVYFFDDAFAVLSDNSFNAYRIDDNGKTAEIYSEKCTLPVCVFASDSYIVILQGTKYKLYEASENIFSCIGELSGKFISAHVYSDSIYVKMQKSDSSAIEIYKYKSGDKLRNITDSMDFAFIDYCYDEVNGNEFYISYEVLGEYIKLVIRIYNNGIQTKRIELDNVVYTDFDYINDLFVFYTENSLLIINTDTLVRREQNCYDVDALQKFIYDNRIVYYWENAFFDGINNMFIVGKETSKFVSFNKYDNLCKYNNNLIYSDADYVKYYNFSGTLIDDNVLFSDNGIQKLGVMGDVIAVIKTDKIVFIK